MEELCKLDGTKVCQNTHSKNNNCIGCMSEQMMKQIAKRTVFKKTFSKYYALRPDDVIVDEFILDLEGNGTVLKSIAKDNKIVCNYYECSDGDDKQYPDCNIYGNISRCRLSKHQEVNKLLEESQ